MGSLKVIFDTVYWHGEVPKNTSEKSSSRTTTFDKDNYRKNIKVSIIQELKVLDMKRLCCYNVTVQYFITKNSTSHYTHTI